MNLFFLLLHTVYVYLNQFHLHIVYVNSMKLTGIRVRLIKRKILLVVNLDSTCKIQCQTNSDCEVTKVYQWAFWLVKIINVEESRNMLFFFLHKGNLCRQATWKKKLEKKEKGEYSQSCGKTFKVNLYQTIISCIREFIKYFLLIRRLKFLRLHDDRHICHLFIDSIKDGKNHDFYYVILFNSDHIHHS
jgi:hypothetical protein